MQEKHLSIRDNEEIDLSELMRAIWAGKHIIIITVIVFTISSIIYALNLPNIYKSEVTLAPAGESSGLNLPGQLGGLAALAGVNLGSKGGDKSSLALEILKSKEFLGQFIQENDLFISIMAAEGWDRASDKLIIDQDDYNESTKQWVREVKEPFKPKPSILETIEEFEKNYSVSQDKVSGMVKISYEHYSPYIAKQITENLVTAINENMRKRDLIEAEKSINYLNKKIQETNLTEAKEMLFSLIEEQTKTVMLANVRGEYVFKTIDPAVIAEKKERPMRALIVALFVILGFMLSVIYVIISYFSKRQ